MTTLTLLGLGSGSRRLLTAEAREHLETAQQVTVATLAHPTVEALPPHLSVDSFDALYERIEAWNTLPQAIATAVVERVAAGEAVTYAVPGHPLVGNLAASYMRVLARERGVAVRVIAGLSFVEPVCEALSVDVYGDGVQIVDALALIQTAKFPTVAEPSQRAWSEMQDAGPYTPPLLPFPVQPTQPALLYHPHHRLLGRLKHHLLQRYPATHSLVAIRFPVGNVTPQLETCSLDHLDQLTALDQLSALYLAPLPVHEDVHDIQSLNWVTARLLGPAGCPWDREQTHASLRRYLLEEAHEVLEALDANDWDALSEELGDLLLQIVLHSEMARQADRFSFGDVTAHITRKLIRRHPHVFGELAVSGSGEVLRNWEAIKAQEHAAKGAQRASLLDGVPTSLPALAGAQLLGEKAAKVGFDWPDIDGVWAKVYEELDEVRDAAAEQRSEEFGDLLFVLARLASWLKVDVEAALRAANAKFKRRFAVCERLANGANLAQLSAEALDALWNEAKREEGKSPEGAME